MAGVELRHLSILEEIYKTHSVTKAAANLGLSQPAISIALAQLRRHFNDPLFVRTSEGMKPTPHLQQMLKPLREALQLIDQTVGRQAQFDPARSDRVFRICMADLGNIIILPKLMAHLREHAPGVRLETIPFSADTPRQLEFGEADIAIGVPARLQAGFFQQRLFREDFVCVVRKDHPRIKSQLTLKQFRAENHILVTTPWTSHWIVEKAMEKMGVHGNIVLRVAGFLGLPQLVADGDLVVTVPRRVGAEFSASGQVKLFPAPVGLPSYIVTQHWHERYHHDAPTKWLRGAISALFSE